MARIKWYSPKQEPQCDALVVSDTGKFIVHIWDTAGPGIWERLVKERGIKKWRKIMKWKKK